MAKSKAGLPEGFSLNLDSPSELGDYLDEDFGSSAARVIAVKKQVAPAIVPDREPEAEEPRRRPVAPPKEAPRKEIQSEPALTLVEPRSAQKPRPVKRPERMEFNMRPETVKMFDEIVESVRRYSVQEDVKASEILDAVIGVLYEARDEMKFQDVPRRGKWGSPTARAFPIALGNAFARAIATANRRKEQR